MAFLDNSGDIILDAVLTDTGRFRLAKGEFKIQSFALGDDEIDYTLYEPAHPKGSAYYDAAIKAIPVTEASPDETQTLRYKLVTLPKGTTKIPKVEFGVPSISVNQNSGQVSLTPTTSPSGNTQSGYTVVLSNKNAGSIVGAGLSGVASSVPTFLGDEITATAAIETGLTFTFIPNPNITATIATTITVYGNETGGSQTIPVTITYVS